LSSVTENVFVYIANPKAPLYRTIIRVFMESKERFVFQLGFQDIVAAVQTADAEEIEAALAQLCEWGNLQTCSDTTSVKSLEDFLKPRQIFEITARGANAARTVATVETGGGDTHDFDGTALVDIREAIHELKLAAQKGTPDAGKIHRHSVLLRTRFENLTATAEALVAAMDRSIRSQSHDAQPLAEFSERFVADLVLTAASVEEVMNKIESTVLESIIQAVVERTARSGVPATPEHAGAIRVEWRSFWIRFRNWFISEAARVSTAEVLRERLRGGLPALLKVITTFNDRRIHRIDRSSDFRVMARWFAEADSDAAAHRLWHAVFGLTPARHLLINEATLDDFEAQHLPANISWRDAPPLRLQASFRDYSSSAQAGGLTYLIDKTTEKEKLAAAAHEEALRILNAQSRFGTGDRVRLSQLEELETGEFDLLLDMLAEAVSARVLSTEPVEIFSGDGCLKIKLEPTGDGREACILTAEGLFSGPDHWITIEHLVAEELLL
jgi:uncharacterized protein (TIGR02677 family)